MIADFSFNNLQIKAYFEGSDSYVPTGELLYIHQHPLIRPNFLAEIEGMLNETGVVLLNKKSTGAVVNKFTALAIDLSKQLPTLTASNAASVLGTLREIYQLCKKITGKQ